MNLKFPWARKFVRSPYLDLFGAALILVISITRNFQGTMYKSGEIIFNVPLINLSDQMAEGAFPLGLVSILSAMFSLLSTRFIGKQSNIGNIIGVFTTITAGTIDYLFGNASAIITYPSTFIIMNFAVFNWAKGEKIKKLDWKYYTIMAGGIALGFALVYLGASLFGGRTDTLFLNTVAITFGISIGANISSALKYEETWLSWMIYNIVQLTKNALQFNYANVAKYIFYMINAIVTLVDWKFNGDRSLSDLSTQLKGN
ncbi:nicotinamide mononucleotide transporter family protein [Portibacter marinus]|uniref:nicotinamide mononucleotide transporter family protein n=1 Tax=Portibacter marinus TaxID=2898660 RepID=UPI001F26018E|nr:nicotinamide mononucleotide transporter family protein [Portibacter marinus]